MKTNDSWGYPASLNIRSRIPDLLPNSETPFDNLCPSSFLLYYTSPQTTNKAVLGPKRSNLGSTKCRGSSDTNHNEVKNSFWCRKQMEGVYMNLFVAFLIRSQLYIKESALHLSHSIINIISLLSCMEMVISGSANVLFGICIFSSKDTSLPSYAVSLFWMRRLSTEMPQLYEEEKKTY